MENSLQKNWLALAVTALGLSGIFSILLIIGRTSNALDFLGIEEFFKVSLIVHVNLGVLVWLLSMTVAIIGGSSKLNFLTACLATALITISGITYSDGAFLNNYIPMFENLFFKLGIGLFIIIFALENFKWISSKNTETSSIAALFIIAFLVLSYTLTATNFSATHAYYEDLYWGFGHLLQFVYTQILVIVWLKLARPLIKNENLKNTFLLLPVFFVFISTLYIIFSYDIGSAEYSTAFTQQMIWGGGLAAIPFGLLLIKHLASNLNLKDAVSSSLLFSIILFGLGGALAGWAAKTLLIDGEITTIIPAHYHGSTIGVSVAMMGFAYHFLSIKTKAANRQIWIYSIGQIMYIIGLAVIGGHGAARKTAGTEGFEHLEIFIHLMRWGGLFVLIGGLMFMWIIWKGFRQKEQH